MSNMRILLSDISNFLQIYSNITESQLSFRKRLIYSAIGRMALCSIWDNVDDNQKENESYNEIKASITYFKRRVENLQKYYQELFPELTNQFLNLNEVFLSMYLDNGWLYHSSNWLYPAIEKTVVFGGIKFIRGNITPTSRVIMSGLGMYEKGNFPNDEFEDFCKTFHFTEDYRKYVNNLLNEVQWNSFNIQENTEYLRLNGNYTRGYWKNLPDSDGKISLLRIGQPGNRLYYFYKYENDSYYVSSIPNWATENREYVRIAIGLMLLNNKWPGYTVKIDGNLAFLRFNYLLPPPELNFFKFYSWPDINYSENNNDLMVRFANLVEWNSDFERIMTIDVFNAFNKILSKIGLKGNYNE